METRIDLPADGNCTCGCGELMLAEDKVQYTPVNKAEGAWEREGAYLEELDDDDPMGNVRLFCTACGQYFNVPEELP